MMVAPAQGHLFCLEIRNLRSATVRGARSARVNSFPEL